MISFQISSTKAKEGQNEDSGLADMKQEYLESMNQVGFNAVSRYILYNRCIHVIKGGESLKKIGQFI